jgi:S-adenosylmethionine decarboxylase
MIAESHISIHTFPEHREVSIDVFSCKEFDAVKTADILKEAFDLSEAECVVLRRGLEYERGEPMLPQTLPSTHGNGHTTKKPTLLAQKVKA